MECWLLNAAHMKAVPGRKSDVRDAEWIAQLVEHGLVRPSLVSPPEIHSLRNLIRNRVQLMGDRTRDAGRLEKLLEGAWIKLSVVASNITGISARDMLGAPTCADSATKTGRLLGSYSRRCHRHPDATLGPASPHCSARFPGRGRDPAGLPR